MSNNTSEKAADVNRRIVLSEEEVSEISLLYDAALKLSQTSINSQNNSNSSSYQKGATFPMDESGSNPSFVIQRKKAWHAVQECLERLGKKYNYDPEKFVINRITRELEPYSPGI